MIRTRYALRPRVGERLHYGTNDTWPIVAVRDDGRTIDVVDTIGRPWTLTRAGHGCWLVDRVAS